MRPKQPFTDPAVRDPEYTPEQIRFMNWINRKKRETNTPYPSWAEVLRWAKELGYHKGK